MGDAIILAGCGNMGHAMLVGWLGSGRLEADDVVVVEPSAALRERAAEWGVHAVAGADEIPGDFHPRLVVLAVKPQVMRDVAPAYRRYAQAGATTLSVAAGISVATLETLLGAGAPIIRCMPNTPAAIGRGMLVTYASPSVDADTASFIEELLKTSGRVASIAEENLMDAVTAVSGSGPAYVFHFIEALTAAGKKAGLPEETAALLAMQTVFGAASLAADSSDTPGTLREKVTSPKGTTAAALSVLMAPDGLEKLLFEAVEAARKRSIELGA